MDGGDGRRWNECMAGGPHLRNKTYRQVVLILILQKRLNECANSFNKCRDIDCIYISRALSFPSLLSSLSRLLPITHPHSPYHSDIITISIIYKITDDG